ncbi:uncharacterized protein LOC132309830 [Cornus florida]|uniref:uncharacterized protein LOC132309830 n=1 Tax=Cornus florida TaxID=4283 RepID=UPI00289FFFC7|nr:uncharacterized protein LOC132309830 [Cornus florida]
MRAITSTYHLLMRFPTEQGVGELRGDQTTGRECYVASLREKKQQEALVVEEIEEQERDRAKSIEDLVEICLNDNGVTKKVKIGYLLPLDFMNTLVQFLRQNQDVFAWSHEDMPSIDPATIEHRLNKDPTVKPIRQKRRTFAAERNMAISEEVNKLLKADFIQEVNYPDWLANVVLVKKRPMENGDREKTSFVTDRGLYCYKVMPFRHKNAGVTYQRLVNLMFKNQIGRNIEVYVDDMLVKSLKAQDHLADQ